MSVPALVMSKLNPRLAISSEMPFQKGHFLISRRHEQRYCSGAPRYVALISPIVHTSGCAPKSIASKVDPEWLAASIYMRRTLLLSELDTGIKLFTISFSLTVWSVPCKHET